MDSALDEIKFLADSANRVDALVKLSEGPCDRGELQAVTGASSATVGRLLGDFEELGWVRREDHDYVLTEPGAFVAEHFTTFHDRLAAERELRDVWRWLPSEVAGFTLELVAGAEVTIVEPGNPYGPANRCAALYAETERVKGFDAAMTAPHLFEELYQRIIDGMETEAIIPPRVSEDILSAYPEKATEVRESDALTLWLHDDLPLYRVLVFDDRVGIGGYDPETGVLQISVDTDAPEVRDWAMVTFESYREEATRLAPDRQSSSATG